MTEKLYRIKPVEWKEYPYRYKYATPFGDYDLLKNRGGSVTFAIGPSIISDFPTLEDGKKFAESHYRERLMMCLEPISVTVTNDGVYLSVS